MKPPRWTVVSPSAYEWEREALEEHLPDHDPWRAWSNFEFVDDEGRVNEVDFLVLGPAGLILVEIKSRPGTIEGDAHSWNWTTDGRRHIVDNPLLLANRKAIRIACLNPLSKWNVALLKILTTQKQLKISQSIDAIQDFLDKRLGHIFRHQSFPIRED